MANPCTKENRRTGRARLWKDVGPGQNEAPVRTANIGQAHLGGVLRKSYGLSMSKATAPARTPFAAEVHVGVELDEEHLQLLTARVAGSEEAERHGDTIPFEDLLEEVDEILHGAAAG